MGAAFPRDRDCEGQGEKGERGGGQRGGLSLGTGTVKVRVFGPDHGLLMTISREGTPVHVLMPGGMAHMLQGL